MIICQRPPGSSRQKDRPRKCFIRRTVYTLSLPCKLRALSFHIFEVVPPFGTHSLAALRTRPDRLEQAAQLLEG